jgi:hypothetical protein
MIVDMTAPAVICFLTLHVTGVSNPPTLSVETSHVVAIESWPQMGDVGHASIRTDGGRWLVDETPEQIIKMMTACRASE